MIHLNFIKSLKGYPRQDSLPFSYANYFIQQNSFTIGANLTFVSFLFWRDFPSATISQLWHANSAISFPSLTFRNLISQNFTSISRSPLTCRSVVEFMNFPAVVESLAIVSGNNFNMANVSSACTSCHPRTTNRQDPKKDELWPGQSKVRKVTNCEAAKTKDDNGERNQLSSQVKKDIARKEIRQEE